MKGLEKNLPTVSPEVDICLVCIKNIHNFTRTLPILHTLPSLQLFIFMTFLFKFQTYVWKI